MKKGFIHPGLSLTKAPGWSLKLNRKKDLIYAKIDRKKRILGTIFLRALGYETREEIIGLFYKTISVNIKDFADRKEEIVGSVLSKLYLSATRKALQSRRQDSPS